MSSPPDQLTPGEPHPYSKVQPHVPGWVSSLTRRDRKNFTPAKHNARIIADAHKAIADCDAKKTADRAAEDAR
jgi:hypothetical protein